jgi:hypothetical protein
MLYLDEDETNVDRPQRPCPFRVGDKVRFKDSSEEELSGLSIKEVRLEQAGLTVESFYPVDLSDAEELNNICYSLSFKELPYFMSDFNCYLFKK